LVEIRYVLSVFLYSFLASSVALCWIAPVLVAVNCVAIGGGVDVATGWVVLNSLLVAAGWAVLISLLVVALIFRPIAF